MLEFFLAKAYLVPKRKQLSVSLIALMSVGVIALVVWLLLTFLSVLTGIEQGWLKRMTSLHAPIRITPTDSYLRSYNYQIDGISSASNYELKTLREKSLAAAVDPYSPTSDAEPPSWWDAPLLNEKGDLRNLVSEVVAILKKTGMRSDFYETAAGLLRIQLGDTFLSQMTYLASFSENSPELSALLLPLETADLDHFLQRTPVQNGQITQLFPIASVETTPHRFTLPQEMIPLHTPFYAHYDEANRHLVFSAEGEKAVKTPRGWILDDKRLLPLELPLLIEEATSFQADWASSDLQLRVTGNLQGHEIEGVIPWKGIHATRFKEPVLPSLTAFRSIQAAPLFLPKQFKESGVKLGDRGTIAYASDVRAFQEQQRLPIIVAGFYDPGVIAVGIKCLLTTPEVIGKISSNMNTYALDPLMQGGIQVWCDDLAQVEKKANALAQELNQAGLSPYFEITTYRDYDFAKELLQQFRSDKSLFTLIGILILIVACSNILSFLILLVNEKKGEIGILRAMGATAKQIGLIFATCGALVGAAGSLIGSLAAFFTLKHIDYLIHFLSSLQGDPLFIAAFYGPSLPRAFSHEALLFLLISTPILSLIAALVPALKACRLKPTDILRANG